MKRGDRVTYLGLPGKVIEDSLSYVGWWHVYLDRGDKILAPAEVFELVKDEKPIRLVTKGTYVFNNGRNEISVLLDNVPLIATDSGISLDTARIAAPVVLATLAKLYTSPIGTDMFSAINKRMAAIEKEMNDAK